ncbi:MAG TPA: homoserine kinase, partial [Puia sp.]
MKQVTEQCPATVANLDCGFDILGMALDAPFDHMTVTLLDEPGITITSKDGFPLPSDPAQNTAGAPLIAMLEELGQPIGFDVVIHKQIKPGSGVGSSAASAAGSIVAANHLLGNKF